MPSLEIELNGERRLISAVPDEKVGLNAILSYAIREGKHDISLDVGAFVVASGNRLKWPSIALKQNDSVKITITNRDIGDAPTIITKDDATRNRDLESKLKAYYALKDELKELIKE